MAHPASQTFLPVADLVKELKTGATKWIHEKFPRLGGFHWQDGYGAFSVSPGHKPAVVRYIAGQQEHHRQVSFQDEYRHSWKNTPFNTTNVVSGTDSIFHANGVHGDSPGCDPGTAHPHVFRPNGADRMRVSRHRPMPTNVPCAPLGRGARATGTSRASTLARVSPFAITAYPVGITNSVVSLIVEMTVPYQGRVYDPAMGSGGFFVRNTRPSGMRFAKRCRASARGVVQSERFIEEHGGTIGDIMVFGQDQWAWGAHLRRAQRARRVKLRRKQPNQSNPTTIA